MLPKRVSTAQDAAEVRAEFTSPVPPAYFLTVDLTVDNIAKVMGP